MLILHIQVRVKPDCIDAFKQATVANARESLKEPGIARFDFVQQNDDSTRFVLVEAYRSKEAIEAHKATAHYATWSKAVEPCMAEPRARARYTEIFPAAEDW